jgi:predicted enzyme related to lactoylglutathione lyase
MPGFVHVDIGAEDPERAARFYNRVFGWTVTKLEGPVPYWLVTPGEGGPGAGIAKREQSWQTAIPTIEVASADATADAVVSEGGQILVPRTAMPGVGLLITFRDSEGNVLSALEPERPAEAPPVRA